MTTYVFIMELRPLVRHKPHFKKVMNELKQYSTGSDNLLKLFIKNKTYDSEEDFEAFYEKSIFVDHYFECYKMEQLDIYNDLQEEVESYYERDLYNLDLRYENGDLLYSEYREELKKIEEYYN